MNRHTTRRAGIEIDTDLQEFYTGFLDKIAPNARKILEDTLKKIEIDAKDNWPVRQPEIKKDREDNVTSIKIVSKGSWNMFEKGFRILSDGSFEAYLWNRVPYSWAIKFGEDSKNNRGQDIAVSKGKKVANELMIKPQEEAVDRIVSALADDLIRRI